MLIDFCCCNARKLPNCLTMPNAFKVAINHIEIWVLTSPYPLCCSLMRHLHKQKHDLPSKENPNSSNTRTMPGSLTEVPCSVWLLLAVIMTNTNQDQAVHMMVLWHRCGLELYSSWEAFAWEVNPTTSPSSPHIHTSTNYRSVPVTGRARWVWAPDFRSSISVSDTTVGVKVGGIWFKPAGGYSAAAVEPIIAGVIPLLAPHLRPLLPPGGMTFIGSRAVVCDRENHRCSWTHIPPFPLRSVSVR